MFDTKVGTQPIVGDTLRPISHSQAMDSVRRLINSHFGNEDSARIGIPARPNYDDDLLATAYVRQRNAADAQAYVLGLLAEEAGEIVQLVGKALRFGVDTPGRLDADGAILPDTPRSLLPMELGDLQAAIVFAGFHGLVDTTAVEFACIRKLARLMDPAARDNLGRPLAPQPPGEAPSALRSTGGASPAPSPSDNLDEAKKPAIVTLDYTNHRGERKHYVVQPTGRFITDETFHPGVPYLIEAVDVTRGVVRTFDTARIHAWNGVPVPANAKPEHEANPLALAVDLLVAVAHGASSAAGWWIDPKTGTDLSDLDFFPYVVGTKLMLVVSELAEAMEGHRKGLMDDKLPHRLMIEVELADALLRIADLAGKLKCDLGGALVEKMAFNAVRADHQIGARMAAGGKAY